ncbi:DUF1015 family protein [Natronoglycomyces albus]|uniref:DUF1015 family protein n=1 Tax=Natronoglycomyces albus TaxID=2811108 RepID=A0A895XMC8_9ACTN|nr:DUF1015 family protein [Natronoglycomyces albus]QSB06277.1 DUF1015 family protein [Natronoglycomyces albus]
MTAVHPIRKAWLSTGSTGAKNYDEFPDESDITRIIADNPTSVLAVEMPAHTPEAVAAGLDFEAALPAAAQRLTALQQAGRFTDFDSVVVAYRISGGVEPTAYGMYCFVDTGEISSTASEPGRVIRNEDVFVEKVEQRNQLNQQLRHLLSPVLLLQSGTGQDLHEALARYIESAGKPVVADIDEAGRTHEIWAVTEAPVAKELCELASAGDLIVADGNHRSLAAQVGKLDSFLAVVTTAQSVTIRPYHRLVAGLPGSAAQLMVQLSQCGVEVEQIDGVPFTPEAGGTVIVYGGGRTWKLSFPAAEGSVVDRLDHTQVEKEVFGLLGFDPGDKRITYVGGDYEPEWLAQQVDDGKADLAILISPVTVEDFIDVNVQRLKMPRKSTWFVPKARAGLVLADLRD